MGNSLSSAVQSARLHNLIRIASVAEIDAARARVRVDFGGGALSNWLTFYAGAAGSDAQLWRLPEVGEKALILSPSGETGAGIVLAGFYTSDSPAPSNRPKEILLKRVDGARISHDAGTHKLTIDVTAAGTIELVAGPSKITIDASGVKIEGPTINLN